MRKEYRVRKKKSRRKSKESWNLLYGKASVAYIWTEICSPGDEDKYFEVECSISGNTWGGFESLEDAVEYCKENHQGELAELKRDFKKLERDIKKYG